MRNKNNYTEGPTTILTGDVVEPSLMKRSLGMLLSSRSGSLMLQDAMLQAGNDHCHALLAKMAMEHTGALAMDKGKENLWKKQPQQRDVILCWPSTRLGLNGKKAPEAPKNTIA